MSEKDKAERLAAQLRENLRRRKEQARRLKDQIEHDRDSPEQDDRN